ncbi:MAG TPA: cupin domain-containing protein [bacterium]|nr:cupin domain-containing protein [bacterium]
MAEPTDSSVPVDQQRIRGEWAARGYSCGLWVDAPGAVWANYRHGVDELLMLVQGAIELEIDGRTWRPAVGEEVHISAGTIHTVRNVGAKESFWLYGYKS